MRWFERTMTEGGAPRARFADVSPAQRRVPSWVPSRSEARGEASLHAPRLPNEFVSAVRQELDQEYSARARASLSPEMAMRRSERPSLPPSSVMTVAPVVVMAEPPQPAVDPALIQGLEQAISLLANERERILSETAAQVAELAALIARRVIGRELSLDPKVVLGLVREGVEALGQHDRVMVRLGSGFAVAKEAVEEDLRAIGARVDVRFDATLESYGCYIETELGQVDESIEARLETLLLALKPSSEVP